MTYTTVFPQKGIHKISLQGSVFKTILETK